MTISALPKEYLWGQASTVRRRRRFMLGRGGGDFRAVGNGQAVGRGAKSGIGDAVHALGHDSGLRKTGCFAAKQAAGPQKRHPGSGRKRPEWIDHREEHRLPCCPHCQGRLKRMQETHTRYVEDIPENLQAEVTEHTIHRDWCPKCKKRVTPQVPDALPGARLGKPAVVLSAWMHYGLGTTLQQNRGRFQTITCK